MNNVVRLVIPAEAALKKIRVAAKTSEWTAVTRSCRQKMVRQGIASSELFSCLEHGDLIGAPYWSHECQLWQCVLERFVAGERISVTCGVDLRTDEVLVTGIGRPRFS